VNNLRKFFASIKFAAVPVLFAIYPVVFHYGNNIGIAALSSALQLLLLHTVLALFIYVLVNSLGHFQPTRAANASVVFLFFFLFYGLVYDSLKKVDMIQVEHFSFLPFFLLSAIYFSWAIYRIDASISMQLWKGALFIVAGLVIVNIVPVIFVSSKQFDDDNTNVSLSSSHDVSAPDIYYIVFDEMAGFEAMRQYWGYQGVDEFVEYLKSRGFYVAENSRATSQSSIHQLATRLNYQSYQVAKRNTEDFIRQQRDVTNNKVMSYLESNGYTTVAFTDVNAAIFFPGMPSMNADIVHEHTGERAVAKGVSLDDFASLVLGNTMASPLIAQYELKNYEDDEHRNFIFFAVKNVPAVDVPSPKFVYVHLLVPHWPFIFDQYGMPLEFDDRADWDKYLGQYIYSLQLAKQLLDGILDSTNPGNPPVIIFQSDHGARNIDYGNDILQNYPDEYKTWIVNAVFLPGCRDAPLTQDMNPINTFPIVFNCYFNTGIPLTK
jgi:hypothetical protein